MAVKLAESDVDARQPSGTLTLKTFATLVLTPEYASFGATGRGSFLAGAAGAGMGAGSLIDRWLAIIIPVMPRQVMMSVMMTICLHFASICLLYRHAAL